MRRVLKADLARAAARELLETVAPALLEYEHRDFYEEALRICNDLLEAYRVGLGGDDQFRPPDQNR